MKTNLILDWSEDGCCFYAADEDTTDEYNQVVSLIEFLHRSVYVNVIREGDMP
jgi:hypothetical protein